MHESLIEIKLITYQLMFETVYANKHVSKLKSMLNLRLRFLYFMNSKKIDNNKIIYLIKIILIFLLIK